MPRSFTGANGNMLVGLDFQGRLRDLYYPQVGSENHVGKDRQHRIGVHVDGTTYWLHGDDFSVSAKTNSSTSAAEIVARNSKAGITLSITGVVYNEQPIFIRAVKVKNMWDVQRDITLYFCQEFEISQSRQASTAYFDPANECLIHYRGRRVFLINAIDEDGSFTQFTTGVTGIEGKEGSWKDAEDGQLQGNTIEHGPADSCLGLTRTYKEKEERTTYYWLVAGKSIESAVKRNHYIHDRTPEHIFESTQDYWHAWLKREPFHFHDLSTEIVNLFRRSLLVIRSHADNDGGILASSDSDMLQRGKDSYCYVWPRDGVYITRALDRVGVRNVSRQFYSYLERILTEVGYLMHKYGPDGSLGSSWHPWFQEGTYQLPIQEDETATVIYQLWRHYERSKDVEFVEKLYNSLISPAAEFMMTFRHDETGLPKRSYDLWEERIGVHTYTAASVYGGLQAAANFAQLLGKETEAKRFRKTAEEVKIGIMTYLYDDEAKYFVSRGEVEDGEFVQDSRVDFSASFGVWHFGVLSADDDRLIDAFDYTKEALGVPGVGGFARHENDEYYRDESNKDAAAPGNPWFVTTLWYGQYLIDRAENPDDLDEVRQILDWTVENQTSAGVLSEQLDLRTAEPLSATPLVWTHAEFVTTITLYLDKLREFGVCDDCDTSESPF